MAYYSLDAIKKLNAKYNIIFGERSTGKTYAVLEEALKQYQKTGKCFAYLRRWDEDFKGKNGASLFNSHAENGLISQYTGGEWDSMYFYSNRWYFARKDKQGRRVVAPEPVGYAFALSTMEHDKSTSFPSITTVAFDEFLTKGMYLPDEFVTFCNVLSTIIRNRTDVTIYMMANTVSQYAPYWKEMGLNHVKDMKPGSIDLYTYPSKTGEELRVAVEMTDSAQMGLDKASNIYFAFDNPKLSMITGGSNVWELDLYPHCPMEYKTDDIRFSYYILFDDERMKCDIIKKDGKAFTFIHKAKQEPGDRDIIFSQEYHPQKNMRRRIDAPFDKVGNVIWDFFQMDKVYYQDNFVGACVEAYLNWCVEQRV